MKKRKGNKRTNMSSGIKAHNDNLYIKVGRVRMNSWMSKHIPVADIFISERQLVHIGNKHKVELDALGISAFNYVQMIVSQCNQIRKDNQTNAYLFIVVFDEVSSRTKLNHAVIQVNSVIVNKKEVYEIKTAHPKDWKRLSLYEFICDKPRSLS